MTLITCIIGLGITLIFIFYLEFKIISMKKEINTLNEKLKDLKDQYTFLNAKFVETRKDLIISQGEKLLCEVLNKKKSYE